MDDDKTEHVEIERLAPILLGAIMATTAVHGKGIELRDAKIALRVGTFMLDELYRLNPKDKDELERMGRNISGTIFAMIKAEIAAEEPE